MPTYTVISEATVDVKITRRVSVPEGANLTDDQICEMAADPDVTKPQIEIQGDIEDETVVALVKN